MELKTESGVTVRVSHNGNGSRLLTFNLPVQVLEVSGEEATTIASSLARDRQTNMTPILRELKQQGFFKRPKRFGEIKKSLTDKKIPVKSSSLNVVLSKLVDRGELLRKGKLGAYSYQG
jgi:hypothetical protein